MNCPICDQATHAWIDMPIDAKKDAPTPFADVLRCEGCGLGMATRMPKAEEVADLYDLTSYYTHGSSHMPTVRPRLLDRVLTRLAWQVDHARPFDVDAMARRLSPGARVLDIGSGDGELLELFRDRGFDVLGVDPDARSREYCATKGLTVLPGTAEHPPEALEGQAFDLIIMSHSLEHCLDPVRAIQRIGALLSPRGLAYVEVPNAGCRHFETFRQCSEMFDAPRHLWFFNQNALLQLTRRQGFRVAQSYHNGFTRLFSPSWRGWECEIYDRLARRGFRKGAVRHSWLRSLLLLAQTAFARPDRKYDSIGLLISRDRQLAGGSSGRDLVNHG
jgi:SAM-dependent methyltransferase